MCLRSRKLDEFQTAVESGGRSGLGLDSWEERDDVPGDRQSNSAAEKLLH